MRDACAALAVRLQTKFHLQCGDRIGVCLPNSPEFPIAALGSIEAGLVVTTINPIYTAGKSYANVDFDFDKYDSILSLSLSL